MDLNVIVNIFQILGTLILIYEMWLGLKQFKLEGIQRHDSAIMECAQSFEDKEFTEAYGLLTNLDRGFRRRRGTIYVEYT